MSNGLLDNIVPAVVSAAAGDLAEDGANWLGPAGYVLGAVRLPGFRPDAAMPAGPRKGRTHYPIGPALVEVDFMVATPGQWRRSAESAEPGWQSFPVGAGLVVALRLTV